MAPFVVLVSGIPRAGKSSFADAVEESELGLTHVPLDRYIMAVPAGESFLGWVREPSCIDWPLLAEHMNVLFSGRPCYTPRPDWKKDGLRACEGGAVEDGLGRRMSPSENGYVVAGTHSFSLSDVGRERVTVWVDTPDEVIASRFEKRAVSGEESAGVLRAHLSDNDVPLRALEEQAALAVNGTASHANQIAALELYLLRAGLIG